MTLLFWAARLIRSVLLVSLMLSGHWRTLYVGVCRAGKTEVVRECDGIRLMYDAGSDRTARREVWPYWHSTGFSTDVCRFRLEHLHW